MKIINATLISREIKDWPVLCIREDIPLGKKYRVDLDSKRMGILKNLEHPEWGQIELKLILDVEENFPLPTCCLKIG